MTVDEYADQLVALLPPGKAFPVELGSVMRSICLAMADGLARVDAAAEQLLKDVDPGGFTDNDIGELWLNLVGDEGHQDGEITPEKLHESVLHKLTAGGTPTAALISERVRLRGGDQWQSDPATQVLNTNAFASQSTFADILPAQVRLTLS